MYAIEEGIQKINGEVVETFIRDIAETNTGLLVEAGTTGYKGGICRDAGGRTYLSIVCECGDFHFRAVTNEKVTNEKVTSPVTNEKVTNEKKLIGIEIACCGDAGLTALMKALEFAQAALNDQRCEIDD